MPRRFRRQPDGVDSDQIGRMRRRRRRERSVNSELARRLRGFKGRTRKYLSGSSAGRGMRQRVVVKTHVSRHKPGKARGSLARHVSYLGRESASADGKHGVFYDAAREGVDARQEAVQWAQDRHHFRLIVSPERGGDIPDMTAYVREVMRRVERDLGHQELQLMDRRQSPQHGQPPCAHPAAREAGGRGRSGHPPALYIVWNPGPGIGSGDRTAGGTDAPGGPVGQVQGGRSGAVHLAGPDDRAGVGQRQDRHFTVQAYRLWRG